MLDPAISDHYLTGYERARVAGADPALEFVRSLELLERLLPPPPARVLDIGGGPGTYAGPLARRGYQVHLLDPVPLHVTQARDLAASDPAAGFTAATGDARDLTEAGGSQDAVLLFGPLYHLTEAADRRRALAEARRVLRPGGRLLAVGISRFASLLDGLSRGWLDNPEFRPIMERDLADGTAILTRSASRSSSPRRTSTPLTAWPPRPARRASAACRSSAWRGRAGGCASGGLTRGGGSRSCSRRGRSKQSRRCSAAART
jgi:SAM-dependent methyltransferase